MVNRTTKLKLKNKAEEKSFFSLIFFHFYTGTFFSNAEPNEKKESVLPTPSI